MMALLAPLGGSAAVGPAEAEQLDQALEPEPAAAEQPVEAVEEVDASDSVEYAEPKAEISNDYFIDVKDNTPGPPPWWW